MLNLKDGEELQDKLNDKSIQIVYVQVPVAGSPRNDIDTPHPTNGNSAPEDKKPSAKQQQQQQQEELEEKITQLKEQHQHHITSIHDSQRKKIEEIEGEMEILAGALEEQTRKMEVSER